MDLGSISRWWGMSALGMSGCLHSSICSTVLVGYVDLGLLLG